MTSLEANRVLPPPNEAGGAQRYLEQHSVLLVSNRQLRIALLALTVACLALALMSLRTLRAFRSFKPLVIRINDVGRAEAVAYDSLTYQPRDAEVKYFLIQFVTRHYGRMRATVRRELRPVIPISWMAGWPTQPSRPTRNPASVETTFLASEGDGKSVESTMSPSKTSGSRHAGNKSTSKKSTTPSANHPPRLTARNTLRASSFVVRIGSPVPGFRSIAQPDH